MNTMNNISSINDLINEVIAESIENEDNVKFLADLAEETSAPVAHKAGRHPAHLKGRERSIADKRFGASAKKCRKDYCGTRKAEWYDACSYHSGKEFSAKRRSILVVEDYNPEFERILGAYGVADVEELLILADEAWAKSAEFDEKLLTLRKKIDRKAASTAAQRLDSELDVEYDALFWDIPDPTWKFNRLFWEAKDALLEENAEELKFLENSSEQEEELATELCEVYHYLTRL